jgi:hypothetical protein
MKRWMFIAAAVLLTLGGLAWFNAPAMAGDYHPRYAHASVHVHKTAWRRHAARHAAYVCRTAPVRAAHVRAYRHAGHRW